MKEFTSIVEKIINYEKEHGMTDSDLAFATHISVEHIHTIKTGVGQVDEKILKDLQKFLISN